MTSRIRIAAAALVIALCAPGSCAAEDAPAPAPEEKSAEKPAEKRYEVRPEIVEKALATYTFTLKQLVREAEKGLARVKKELAEEEKEKARQAARGAAGGEAQATASCRAARQERPGSEGQGPSPEPGRMPCRKDLAGQVPCPGRGNLSGEELRRVMAQQECDIRAGQERFARRQESIRRAQGELATVDRQDPEALRRTMERQERDIRAGQEAFACTRAGKTVPRSNVTGEQMIRTWQKFDVASASEVADERAFVAAQKEPARQ